MSPTLRERLEERTRPLILDGGLGTAIRAQGFDGPCEAFTREKWELFKIHMRFLHAGAEIVSTNTFCADRSSLARHGLEDQAEAIWRTSIAQARAAARFPLLRHCTTSKRQPRYVCGSIGPSGLVPEREHDLRDQVLSMIDAGVDALLVETCTTRAGALLASRVVREVASSFDREVLLFVSFTVSEDGEIAPQSSREDEARELTTLDADLVALNCGFGPAAFDRALTRLRSLRDGPMGAYPNAGLPVERDGELEYPLGPREFADTMLELTRRLDLALVGGCCGTTPAHIRALAGLFPPDDPPLTMPPA